MARLALLAVGLTLASLAASAHGGRGAATCGVERWAVKTLTDPAAAQVRLTPRPTTVDALRALRVPRVSAATPRIPGIETTTYRVRARLVELKSEDDGDVHLVIASPRTGGTMIVEFPSPACTRGGRDRAAMTRARAALSHACGAAESRFTRLRGLATVTGVGFVDVKHGQAGVAPNGIELHPVLAFRSTIC